MKIPRYVGLTCLEDMLVQIDEMGIEHGYNVDRVLWLGVSWSVRWVTVCEAKR
jgi:hypothetical protein